MEPSFNPRLFPNVALSVSEFMLQMNRFRAATLTACQSSLRNERSVNNSARYRWLNACLNADPPKSPPERSTVEKSCRCRRNFFLTTRGVWR